MVLMGLWSQIGDLTAKFSNLEYFSFSAGNQSLGNLDFMEDVLNGLNPLTFKQLMLTFEYYF